LAERPLTDLPSAIVSDLETSQVSIFAVQAQRNELRSRMQMTDVVNRQKIRHAHMVNINRQIMLEGMRADFQKVDRLSAKVVAMVRKARQVRAKTAAGTDLTAAEDQRDYHPGKMGESTGRGNFHDSRRGKWNVRDRRSGRGLPVHEVWELARNAPDHSHEPEPAYRGALGESRTGR
jgi:hypothetical protein